MSELSVLAFVALPYIGLLVWSIIEISRRADLDTAGRVGWLALVVLLPVVGLAIYIVARPPKGAQLSGGRADASNAEALVVLAERRQRGELTDDAYEIEVAAVARVN